MVNKYYDRLYNVRMSRDDMKQEFKRVCKHCGWTNVVFNKYNRVLCKNCNNMVYLNEVDEFKNKMKGLIK